MDPNDTQVGGNHYREIPGEQHWDRVWRKYGRGYFVGQITKYVERYHLKNGKQDLEKARHFLDKLISLEYPDKVPKPSTNRMIFVSRNTWGKPIFKCSKCGEPSFAASLEEAEQIHGDCAGKEYVQQN